MKTSAFDLSTNQDDLARRLPLIPAALKELHRWVVWRWEGRGTQRTKVPYQSRRLDVRAKTNDPGTWSSFEDAWTPFSKRECDGVGFILGDGWVGVDLDHCRDPQTGDISAFARGIIDDVQSYTEVSPSGSGVKIFLRASESLKGKKRSDLEIYTGGRYFAVTGERLTDSPVTVENRQAELASIIRREFCEARQPVSSASGAMRFVEGGRNNAMTSVAGSLRQQGLDAQGIFAALRTVNAAQCKPPLQEDELWGIARSVARYETANRSFPLTEAGDAEHFAAEFGDRVRFDHRQGRWLQFDGTRWVPDTDGALDRLAVASMRLRQQGALAIDDPDQKSKQSRWAIGGESRKRLDNMLSMAKSLKPISDTGEAWDPDAWLLGVGNGVVDLETGLLRPGRPEDQVTLTTPVWYDPNAQCPLFDKFVADIFGQDLELIDYVQRALGYSLTGSTREQCLFILWGAGQNGKSILIAIIRSVLGAYADDLPFSALELHQRSSIPNDIAKLVGKRFVTSAETNDGVRLNEARIKSLTGGDPITARFMRKEFFTFDPVAKFWLATNHKPVVRDESHGFWRRIRLIPFTQQFLGPREDKHLKEKLQSEKTGILRWLVEGCLEWQRSGLEPPEAVLQATGEYRTESDLLANFYDERCIVADDARVQAKILVRSLRKLGIEASP